MTTRPPASGRSEDLATAVADLAWTQARHDLGLGSDEPPFSRWESLPPDQAQRVELALLGVLERMRDVVDDRARDAARQAAAAGASYGDLGDAVGMTRQGARRRWPHLAEIMKAARRT